MILYKYCPPERIDILEQNKIRYTQPELFNDPFEANPYIADMMPPDDWEKVSKIEAKRAGMPEEIRQRILESIRKNPAREKEGLRLLLRLMGRFVGVLSLAEEPDNLLMWAHYADSHSGFIIGFDTNDEYFAHHGRPDAAGHLRKVKYSRCRPNLPDLDKLGLEDVYFTKSTDWEYEQEWRVFQPLVQPLVQPLLLKPKEGIRALFYSLQALPICLFGFPASTICSVTVGCRSTETFRARIERVVKTKQYSHVKLSRAEPDLTEFRMNCVPA